MWSTYFVLWEFVFVCILVLGSSDFNLELSLIEMPAFSQLRRSRKHRILAGVCGGVAEWLGWNVSVVRVLFVIGSILPIIPGFVVYVVLWVVVPEAGEEKTAKACPTDV